MDASDPAGYTAALPVAGARPAGRCRVSDARCGRQDGLAVVFLCDQSHAEQLSRWGLESVTAAMAFPAQLGPPKAPPRFSRVAGGSNDSCYRLWAGEGEPFGESGPLFLKQIRFEPATWRYLFRPSRVLDEAANLAYLNRLGIPCPRVVAAGEVRQPGGPVTNTYFVLCGLAMMIGVAILTAGWMLGWFAGPRMGMLISGAMSKVVAVIIRIGLWTTMTAAALLLGGAITVLVLRLAKRDYLVGGAMLVTAIEPSEDLWRFAHEHWAGGDAGALSDSARRGLDNEQKCAQIATLSGQLAGQLALVHNRRFIHGDIKFRNLLVCWPPSQRPDGCNVRLAWIDCPRGRRFPPGMLLTYRRVKDLANLDRNAEPFLTRSQRLRFLIHYLHAGGGDREVAAYKTWARSIIRYNLRNWPK